MALAEKFVKEQLARTPDRYAMRVRWLAVVYFALNVISIAIIVAIAWRIRYFITLSQRSNVETLTLAIIFVLALYYLITTFRGFVGSLRIVWYNAPAALSRDEKARERAEMRKHQAIPTKGQSKYACFDRVVRLREDHNEPIKLQVADEAGKLGELVIEGVRATYYPIKDGMNDSIFEFLADQIENQMQKHDLDAKLQVVRFSTIDEDQASSYFSLTHAFENLEEQLGSKGPLWPIAELSREEVDEIQEEVRKLVPALRNESFLPDVEYEVEYNVPILPEPLGMLRLTRRENRADPVATMGCAGMIMLTLMLVLTVIILWPPWLPSK
jgi:hypothetical protein